MKSIYFTNQSPAKNKVLKVTKFSSELFTKSFPGFSGFMAKKILCNPFSKRNYSFKTNITPVTHELSTMDGHIKLYEFKGGNKHIVLTHGWADNSFSFSKMIDNLTSQGHTVWAFDHIGHGHSYGNTTHLFSFMNGIKAVIHFIESVNNHNIDTFVGHSMGAVALINLDKEYLKTKKSVFISTPIQFFEIMFEKIGTVGLSENFLTNLLETISKTYKINWKDLIPLPQLAMLEESSLFIHDEKDRYAPHEDIKNALSEYDVRLMSTSGLGHGRILKSEDTFKIINEHIN